MDHIAKQQEVSYNEDEVAKIVYQIMDNHLKTGDYDDSKANVWSNKICEDCIEQLTNMKKPFKYVVSCVLQQKTGAGLYSSTTCFWDTSNDAMSTVQWPKANAKTITNQTVHAIVTIFATRW